MIEGARVTARVSQVVKGKPVFSGRPGASLPPIDLDGAHAELRSTYGECTSEADLMSWVMYPKVFEQYKADVDRFGDVSKLPTRAYIEPMEPGEQISVEIEKGKTLGIKLQAVGNLDEKSGTREVFFELNGMPRHVSIEDRNAAAERVVRAKADEGTPGSVGAPMPGVVLEAKVKVGDAVEAGAPMVVLSAMKMETVVAAPVTGQVAAITVGAGDDVKAGDLLVTIADV